MKDVTSMGQIIELSVIREIKLRKELMTELKNLIRKDIDAICQLDNYCLNRRNAIDNRAKVMLVKKGILAEDGTLPDLTNEAMYELRTGQKPYWLQN